MKFTPPQFKFTLPQFKFTPPQFKFTPHSLNLISHSLNLLSHSLNLLSHSLNLLPHSLHILPHSLNILPHSLHLLPRSLNSIPILTLKACQQIYLPPGLTSKNSTCWLCSVFVLSEQTATFALYNIKSLVFITEVESFYSAVRTECLYNTDRFCILWTR